VTANDSGSLQRSTTPLAVPLGLVAAAGLKISADRQKPPRDSVSVGQSVPEISLVGGVSTASDGDLDGDDHMNAHVGHVR
jgi:hypothetical protein